MVCLSLIAFSSVSTNQITEMEETRLRRLYPIEEEAEVGNSEGRTGEEK